MRITTTWLEHAKPRKKRYDKTVDGREGLMVRVYPSGVVSFRFRYTFAGKRQVMVLGEFGKGGLSLAEAFDLHHQAQRELEKDMDPIEERDRRQAEAEKVRQERTESGTVTDLVEQFVHRKLRAERWDAANNVWVRDPKTKTKARKRPDAANQLLQSNLVAKIGTYKAVDVTKRQLVKLLDDIVDRGSPVCANSVHALTKQMFEWAAAKDILPASPMAGIERPGGKGQPRKRKLTEDEIKAVWTKLDTAEMAPATRIALKLLLVTAQRRSEVTFAEWSHFDQEAKLWTIPVELQKTEDATKEPTQPHDVPLSRLALDLLMQLRALAGDSRWVLPSAHKGKDAPYSKNALTHAVRDNQKHFGIAHFTPHDLRRTAASFMTKVGVPRLHVEKVLNHTTGDIAEIYDRHTYLPEKRVALERWGEYLTNLLAGSEQTVLPLAPRKQPHASS